jgi:4-hydroxy-tetrahydrodipicolinate synthase
VHDLYEAGIRVFIPGAGTAEFYSLTPEEIGACVRATHQSVGDGATVIGPVGMGLKQALAQGRAAIDAGADALLVMPPVHPYLSDAGMRDYFDVLIKELPLPLLAYKKGPFPSDALLVELSKAGKLAGVKYAVNDLDALTQFMGAVDPRTGVYCGTAERFAVAFMAAGVPGYTTGAGNLCPRITLAMHAALTKGDYAEARRLQKIIRPIEDYRARAGDSYNVSMLKYGLSVVGYDFGPPRPPMRRLTSNEQVEIRTLLEPILAEEARLKQA